MAEEPRPWTYQLHGGPCDGHEGRCIEIRAAIVRPSTVDPKKIHIYHPTYTDGTHRHVMYRYSHDGYDTAVAS